MTTDILATAPPQVRQLAQVMHEAGHQLFLVGGCVRDAMIGLEPDDWDLATDATPDETIAANGAWADALWDVGREYGTIAMSKGGLKIEVTTFREERYEDGDRHPLVSFTRELDGDLSRRDLTINAMAVDALTGELHDPYDGEGDLRGGLLRTPLRPERTFADDPLRMLRLARFQARFPNARPDGAAVRAMSSMRPRILDVSRERVLDELRKTLAHAQGRHKAIMLLEATGLLDEVLPTAARSRHACLTNLHGKEMSFPALLSVFFDKAEHVEWICRTHLKTRTEDMRDIERLVRMRGRAWMMMPTKPTIRRLAIELADRRGGSLIDDFLLLEMADGSLSPERWLDIRWLREEMAGDGEPVVVSSTLDGGDVMRLLGLEPGPEVGKALAIALEHRIEHGILWKGEAARLLAAAWADRA